VPEPRPNPSYGARKRAPSAGEEEPAEPAFAIGPPLVLSPARAEIPVRRLLRRRLVLRHLGLESGERLQLPHVEEHPAAPVALLQVDPLRS